MLRSMFSGVSGLRSHQTMMDVIGNNIANVNTVGYKAGTTVFQDLLSQAIRGAGVPDDSASGAGGTNPAQVGLGVTITGISNNFTQGASQLTGRATDLSIQGDGFFVVRDNGEQLYTRAGSLNFDALGRLTTADGSILQGWTADASGVINPNACGTSTNRRPETHRSRSRRPGAPDTDARRRHPLCRRPGDRESERSKGCRALGRKIRDRRYSPGQQCRDRGSVVLSRHLDGQSRRQEGQGLRGGSVAAQRQLRAEPVRPAWRGHGRRRHQKCRCVSNARGVAIARRET